MIEEQMAKSGVKMGSAGGGRMSMQICMTKAMAERNECRAAGRLQDHLPGPQRQHHEDGLRLHQPAVEREGR